MPTYDYECLVCDNEFEIEQSINDEAVATCPQCKVSTHRRLISKTSFLLKGSGWAADNYSSQKK